jgi:hypothetical protein
MIYRKTLTLINDWDLIQAQKGGDISRACLDCPSNYGLVFINITLINVKSSYFLRKVYS